MVTPSSKGRWLLYRTEGTVLAITQPPAFTQNSPSPGAVPLAWPVAARSQVLPFPSRSDLSVSLLASPAPYSNTARREALGSTKHPQPGQLKNPFVCLVEPLGCHPAQAGLAVPWRGSCVRSYPGHAGSSAHTAATLFFVPTVLNQIFGSIWPEAPGVVPQSDWGPGQGGHAGSQTPQASPCCCRGGSWASILCYVSASLAGGSCRYTQEATPQVRNRKISPQFSHRCRPGVLPGRLSYLQL